MTEDTGSGRGLRHIYYQFVICPPPSSSPMILISCNTVCALSSAHLKLLIKNIFYCRGIYFTSKIIFHLYVQTSARAKNILFLFFIFIFPLFWAHIFTFFQRPTVEKNVFPVAFLVLKKRWCMFSLFLWYRNKAEGAAVKFHRLETTSLDPILTFYWRTADQSWRRNQIKN